MGDRARSGLMWVGSDGDAATNLLKCESLAGKKCVKISGSPSNQKRCDGTYVPTGENMYENKDSLWPTYAHLDSYGDWLCDDDNNESAYMGYFQPPYPATGGTFWDGSKWVKVENSKWLIAQPLMWLPYDLSTRHLKKHLKRRSIEA